MLPCFWRKKAAFNFVVSVHFELSLQSSVCIIFGPRLHFVLDMQPAFCTQSAVLYLVCSLLFALAVWWVFMMRLPMNANLCWINQTSLLNLQLKAEIKSTFPSPLILQLVKEHRKGHVSHTTTTYTNVKTANRLLLFPSEINTLLSLTKTLSKNLSLPL